MPAKLDRCVADVEGQSGVDNPWAVCNASLNEMPSNPQFDQMMGENPYGQFIPGTNEEPNREFAIPNSLSAQDVAIPKKKLEEAFTNMYNDLTRRDTTIETAVRKWLHS